MAENSKIEWTDATFNPWRGCTKVSAGCAHCYADTQSKRNPAVLGVWGPSGTRVVLAEAGWRDPVKWNRLAAEGRLPDGSPNPDGHRPRVFCASLADVFEGWDGPMTSPHGDRLVRVGPGSFTDETSGAAWKPTGAFTEFDARDFLTMADVRKRLFGLIDATPNLDWLLVTKRPENIARMMPAYFPGGYIAEAGTMNQEGPRPNVWLITSVEDQPAADRRIDQLLKVPAVVHGLSMEPLLGAVDLSEWTYTIRVDHNGDGDTEEVPCKPPLGWVIVGGESGPGARPFGLTWARSIVAQCKAAGVPVFVKQLGAVPTFTEYLGGWPKHVEYRKDTPSTNIIRLRDPKGGDWNEWGAEFQVREFPAPAEITP